MRQSCSASGWMPMADQAGRMERRGYKRAVSIHRDPRQRRQWQPAGEPIRGQWAALRWLRLVARRVVRGSMRMDGWMSGWMGRQMDGHCAHSHAHSSCCLHCTHATQTANDRDHTHRTRTRRQRTASQPLQRHPPSAAMGGSRAAGASSRSGRRVSSASPSGNVAGSSQRSSRRSPSGARRATSAASPAAASAASATPMRTRTRTKRRTSQRAQSVPPKHKYDSPRSEAEMLKRAQEEKGRRNNKPTQTQRRAKSTKERAGRTATSAHRLQGASASRTKSGSQMRKQSGSRSRSGKAKSASKGRGSRAKGQGKGQAQRSSSASSGDDADEDEAQAVARPAAAPKLSAVDRLRLLFDHEGLEERLREHVSPHTAATAVPFSAAAASCGIATRAIGAGPNFTHIADIFFVCCCLRALRLRS